MGSLFGYAAALRPREPTAPVYTCPVGPQTSSGIVIARFGRSQELSVASRGAAEAPTHAGPVFEAPRRRDATDRHGKTRRARRGRSASRAARATPSVACSSGLSRPGLLPRPSARPRRSTREARRRLAATPVPARRIGSTRGARRLLLNPRPAVPPAHPAAAAAFTPHSRAAPAVIPPPPLPLRARLAHETSAEPSPCASPTREARP